MIGWTSEQAWRVSPVKLCLLVGAGMGARLSLMAGFIGALFAVRIATSKPYRLKLLEKYDMAMLGELGLVLALVGLVAGIILFSVVCGLWRRQNGEGVTDHVAKRFQQALFAKFTEETERLQMQGAQFTRIYALYSARLESTLILWLKAAATNVIDMFTHALSLLLTLIILVLLDPIVAAIVLPVLAVASAVYLAASHRQHHALMASRRKTMESTGHRFRELSTQSVDERDSVFWEQLTSEHDKIVAAHLEGAGQTHRFYSGLKGWSLGRIISMPTAMMPAMTAVVFILVILYFFERSEIAPIDLTRAIATFFIVRFSLAFGIALSTDLRRFATRYHLVALGYKLVQENASVIDQLSGPFATPLQDVGPEAAPDPF